VFIFVLVSCFSCLWNLRRWFFFSLFDFNIDFTLFWICNIFFCLCFDFLFESWSDALHKRQEIKIKMPVWFDFSLYVYSTVLMSPMQVTFVHLKSVNLQYFTLGRLLGRWYKRIVEQESDVPSLIFLYFL
jgi:hypothetical protein